ncbi:MAG: chloride channel protein [Rhodococcus sp.]|nr:chloride channel protein [Rhodococcus sp. (in: high G+C Gram-positive bacteria)]
MSRVGGWIRGLGYVRKWLVLGIVIGIVAGLGAVVFYWALTEATHLLLGGLGGYTPPTAAGDGGGSGSGSFSRAWAIPLVVCMGGLVSGLIVFTLAPEAEGHGTDAAIEAFHKDPKMIRARVVLVKLVASAITIGSGGSGGREGPTAQISAGFGSLLARILDLSPRDGRIAVAVGIGSGIGAIFGAPLGGALLCGAIVFKDDFEFDVIIPGLITSIVSYCVFGTFLGFGPLFGYAAVDYRFDNPGQLVWFAIIGVLAGIIGVLYSKGFYLAVDLFHRMPVTRALRPAIGGLMVGLLALAIPQVLGSGYGWVQQTLTSGTLMDIPLWIIVVLPLAKILATALSIGSGGSGGIFGPGMVIGAFTGAAVWRVLEPIAPAVPASPAPFVIVGMMACFGSVARAPLAVMIMVAEMTGSITLLAPSMIAIGLAYLIVRHSGETIYRAQLSNREEGRLRRLLARTPVVEVMTAPRPEVDGDTGSAPHTSADSTVLVSASVEDALAAMDGPDRQVAVVDDAGTVHGSVSRDDIAQWCSGPADTTSSATIRRVLGTV